ncbi:hypothetical protein [Anatilimnocola floriformis]|uniref:hypothetical protein n=1 Tax=Anatilimnocola floriformis TaxID=2948575 RepID=UPI0020C4F65B|nr:hypothetical protein [Anatilimnocola floriformis]
MSTASTPVRTLLLAAVVAAGLSGVWFMLVTTLISIVERSGPPTDFEQITVRADGEPVILKQNSTGVQQQLLTLDRQPTAGNIYQILHLSHLPLPGREMVEPAGRDWSQRLAWVSDGGSPQTYWYLIHDGEPDGHAYGVGYSSVTRRVVGYIGKSGFTEHLPPRDDWFQFAGNAALAYGTTERVYREPYWNVQPSLYLLASGKLWDLNTRTKTVKEVLDCPEAVGIGWAWQTAAKLPEPKADGTQEQSSQTTPRAIMLRTPNALIVVESKTGKSQKYPLPQQLQPLLVGGVQLADGQLLAFRQTPAIQTVAWIDQAGKLVAEKEVVLNSSVREMKPASVAVVSSLVAPAPVWQLCMLGFFSQVPLRAAGVDPGATAFGRAISLGWPGFVVILCISLGVAWATYRRQVSYRLPGAIAWAIFVLMFGPLGYLTYRWHRTWPVLDDCPNCNHQSPRDRELCTECGVEFPPPKLTGTEVFA